jgi:hypothetical protein
LESCWRKIAFQEPPWRKHELTSSPRFDNRSTILWPGVDVMITIFCDFSLFSTKKLAFFSKTNVMIKSLHNLALFWVKTPFFRWIFRRKYFKNHNIGPRA